MGTAVFGTNLAILFASRQGHLFGMSFHPELTDDDRIHAWRLAQVCERVGNVQSQ
ncbi:hypothetical protein F5882DRAFT_416773 [Hyaloscypha sp. PMI_1271]|nr:hypothetical protein F5882DRAFT_416773 [Hyaloscypha sp. PMI_1271]